MLLFSDRITPAFYAVKSSANHLDTFKCLEAGHLGLMNNLTPHFFYEPSKATKKPFFDISKYQNLPKVALLHCYIDMDLDELEKKASDPETKGVVIAGWGAVSSRVTSVFTALVIIPEWKRRPDKCANSLCSH